MDIGDRFAETAERFRRRPSSLLRLIGLHWPGGRPGGRKSRPGRRTRRRTGRRPQAPIPERPSVGSNRRPGTGSNSRPEWPARSSGASTGTKGSIARPRPSPGPVRVTARRADRGNGRPVAHCGCRPGPRHGLGCGVQPNPYRARRADRPPGVLLRCMVGCVSKPPILTGSRVGHFAMAENPSPT